MTAGIDDDPGAAAHQSSLRGAILDGMRPAELTGNPSLLRGHSCCRPIHCMKWHLISRLCKGSGGSTLPPWLVVACNDLHGCVQVHATWCILCQASLAALPLRRAPAAAAGHAAVATTVLVSICCTTMAATLWSNLPASEWRPATTETVTSVQVQTPEYHQLNKSETHPGEEFP